MTGYLHPGYAQSLSELGVPRELPACGGWILERQISETSYRDAMGCYPLFLCRNWSRLHLDLDDLKHDLVSLALVTDPFADCDPSELKHCFDVMIPFKEHLIADLSRPIEAIVSKHHRYWARKALRETSVELCSDPMQYIGEWVSLYGNLIRRHNVKGIQAFSRESFVRQFQVPGFAVFRAVYRGETVGMQTYFVNGDVGYGHLMAISETGYHTRAAYAMTWSSFQHFSDKLKYIDIGGTAGVSRDESDGLLAFKKGWATGTRTAYFCGRVLDDTKYREAMLVKGTEPTDYFPAYRAGEFS